MSANDDGEEIPGREIAYRVFAAEYDDASLSYAESDEERAPNYVIAPTGARLNRLFAVGTLTEVTSVNDEMVRARVVDPTGAFVVYAGQYQPDELATLEQLDPPEFVAVTGKARTFQPEDSDRVYTSIRPESIATVDAATRDRWVVSAAEQTLERIGTYAAAADLEANAEPRDADGDALSDVLLEDGVESGLADGIPLAQGHYGTTPAYLAALRDCALEAVEVVAGDRDQVSGLSIRPDESSPEYETTFGSLAELADVDVDSASAETDSQPDPVAATAGGSEPESMSAATADEFSAADDVPTDAAGEDPSFEADETDAETALESDASDAGTEADAGAAEVDDIEPDDSEPDADGETVEFDADDAVETADASDESDDLGDFDAGDSGMYEMDDEEREQLEEEFGAEFATGTEVDSPGEIDIDVPEPDEEPESELEAESEPDAADDDLGEPPASTVDAEPDETSTGDEPSSEVEPEPEPEAESEPQADEDEATESVQDEDEPEADTEPEAEEPADEADEPAADVDLQAYVVETMEELDDGDGADRSELVETVAVDTGTAEEDVEDAIEEALMGGQCYEPDDETLKAI